MAGVYDESIEQLLESEERAAKEKDQIKNEKSSQDDYEASRRVRDAERRDQKYGRAHEDGPSLAVRGRANRESQEVEMKDVNDKASADGSAHGSQRRATSSESERRAARAERFGTESARDRDDRDDRDSYSKGGRNSGGGEYYRRGGGGGRARSRSPDNYYRPGRRDDHYRDRDRGYERGGYGGDRRRDRSRERYDRRYPTDTSNFGRSGREADDNRGSGGPRKAHTPELGDDERDKRTVFVQQLAARLRTKELEEFFSKIGPVKEAQIVKDRVTHRSKGVGYVEFKDEESVQKAIALTGQKLCGIPIIVALTEAEKNRQARTAEGVATQSNGIPFHRLYVGNIHFSVTEDDLKEVFSPFGELEFTQLQKEDMGRSKGYGFVQFVDPINAKTALSEMNGFEIAGRPIRVGLGNDKFTPETTASLMPKFQAQAQQFQGSAFSGAGGRGAHAGGANNFDRASGRDDRGAGGSSALDDSDVGGVNFSNFSRDSLMRKLARTEDPAPVVSNKTSRARADAKTAALHAPAPSRCVVIKNAYDQNTEDKDTAWCKELEEDFREECSDNYGPVVHISCFLDSPDGELYVKFKELKGGDNALKGLNGRWFAGRRLAAAPIVDAIYNTNFPKAAGL